MFLRKKAFHTLNTVFLDAKALLHNLHTFQKQHPWVSVFPTIKGNAYGHGIEAVAKILSTQKLDYICVDSYFEALKVRKHNKTPILIMGYTLPENYAIMKLKNFTFFVYDEASIHALGNLKKHIKIHIKIDTGMARQWVKPEQLLTLLQALKKYPKLELEGLASHFADADSEENTYSQKQIQLFQTSIEICQQNGFSLSYTHIGNTAGTMKFQDTTCNAVRVWIGLYGVNPLSEKDAYFHEGEDLQLVLSLSTTLVAKKQLKKGETVSYNCTYTAPCDMTIGVVPIGYYEALSRKLSSNYTMYFQGKPLPIIGRVCMNLCMLDIQWVDISVWESIEVIGIDRSQKNNIYEMAKRSETIPYECFTRISETIRREVI